jgi:hypothetical protein
MNDEMKKNIARDFGFDKMSQLEQDVMIDRTGKILFESVLEASFDSLSDKDLNDFNILSRENGGDYQKILSFFKERVPKFNEIVSLELNRMREAR